MVEARDEGVGAAIAFVPDPLDAGGDGADLAPEGAADGVEVAGAAGGGDPEAVGVGVVDGGVNVGQRGNLEGGPGGEGVSEERVI